MAKLSPAELDNAFDDCIYEIAERQVNTANVKADWKTLIDSLDTALDTEAATINNYIPLPQRTNFTNQEKALALEIVVARRYLL